jgi:hypothetical protein
MDKRLGNPYPRKPQSHCILHDYMALTATINSNISSDTLSMSPRLGLLSFNRMIGRTIARSNAKRKTASIPQHVKKVDKRVLDFIFTSLLARELLSREVLKTHFFFAVLADSLKALAVGAPGDPGFLIFSPDPAAMRLRLA